MPDLFDATDRRDQRFIDPVANDFPTPPQEITQSVPQPPLQSVPQPEPSPVEPFLSEEAQIPVAPILRTPKHTKMHIFTSYCELPEKVTFENQNDNERILLFLRKDFATNIVWVTASFIFLLLPVGFFQFIRSDMMTIPNNYFIIGLLFYYLLVGAYLFINFIIWYFNTTLITDERIVDIDFENMVYKNVSETKLSLVQDVSYTQTGTIRTVLNYGDVLVQTAGSIDNFDLHAVPIPERVVDIIEDLIGKGVHNV